MNTLRAKIALLLVVAIVSVVGIITWVMLAMLGPPSPERTTEPVADQIEMFLRVAKQDTSALTLVPEPSPGSCARTPRRGSGPSLPREATTLPVSITRKGLDRAARGVDPHRWQGMAADADLGPAAAAEALVSGCSNGSH